MKMITLAAITGALILTGCTKPSEEECIRYAEIADTMMSAKQYEVRTDTQLLLLGHVSNDKKIITIAQLVADTNVMSTKFGKDAMSDSFNVFIKDRCTRGDL